MRAQWRALRAAPWWVQLLAGMAAILVAWFAANGVYQVFRKPAELFFPVSGVLGKAPAETWRQYAQVFREHSTAVITPELLAALAQVESAGNPVATTAWRWRMTVQPFELYRPASSAVGMYQITDGTFREARRYCIHDHAVVEDGPWHDFGTCWFNSLYLRVVPSHAVEMTSAYLDRTVAGILARNNAGSANARRKHDLAAIVHLCGTASGEAYARRGFQPLPGQRCGEHGVHGYLARVNAMKAVFGQLAQGA